jgi:hypothetical chaperone protein
VTAVGYGIDFGTSNSTLAVAFDDSDDVRVIDVDDRAVQQQMRATLLYLDRDELTLTGARGAQSFMLRGAARTACSRCSIAPRIGNEVVTSCRQYAAGSSCIDGRLLAGLKFELAESSFDTTHSWGTDYGIEQMVAHVLRDLRVQGDKATGERVTRVVVGHPFVFHGAQGPQYRARQALALGRLERAAKLAGFEEVVLLPEPQAAALVEEADKGLVVTTDFGGGTFDVSVIDFDSDPARVVAVEGAAIGGELIDAALFDAFISPELGLASTYRGQSGAQLSIPAHVRRRLRSLSDLKHLMRDADVAVLIRQLKAAGLDAGFLEELLYGGQAYAFFKAVEQAKLDLSAGQNASIDLRRIKIDRVIKIEQADFAALLAPFIDQTRQAVLRALTKAGRDAGEVSYAVRTGGSSQLPAFQDMLVGLFGRKKIIERDPFTTVVQGLALEAQGRWS